MRTQTHISRPVMGRRSRPGRLALASALMAMSALLVPGGATAQGDPSYRLVEGSFIAKAHAPLTQPLAYEIVPLAPHLGAVIDAPDVFQAGAHPSASTRFRIVLAPNGHPRPTRDIIVDGPPGFAGNTTAVPACPMDVFMGGRLGACSNLSQVGVGSAQINDPTGQVENRSPIFKLPPSPDAPARFGYRTSAGEVIILTPRVRSDDDYGIRFHAARLPSRLGVRESVSTLWGVPYDSVHDAQRIQGNGNYTPGASIPAHVERKALLINPTYCDSGPLPRTIHARPWFDPELWDRATVFGAQAPDGCDKLEFGTARAPVSLTLQPDGARAGGPTALDVRLRLPFNHDPKGLSRPALRATKVEFPDGLVINPSAAHGLAACSLAQIGLDSLDEPSCPDGSKIGTVKVTTPLLERPLDGTLFLAEQNRNPFNSMMAVYLHVTGQGVQAKVAGRVDRDPVTGRITTEFDDNPQVPFTELDLRLNTGERASLVLPEVCGGYSTKSTLTPWSHPHTGPSVVRIDPFTVGAAKGCVASLGARPFGPAVSAGTVNAAGGRFSQFNARFVRPDGQKEYDRITVRTPKGLAASIKDVPYCSEAAIAQAISRDQAGDGAVERANPSCPAASRVGTTRVSAGAGPTPFYVSGSAYLAGPYKGAPLSLVFIVPAVAGPFDLGVQVVRAAIHVDRSTAQITTVSEEIPKILEGVPLRIRDIQVAMDRDRFTVNPTSCAEQQVAANVFATQGGRSDRASRFQVGDCAALPFSPRMTMRLAGRRQVRTGGHPAIRAQVVQRGVGEAGIGRAKVTLPASLALDVDNAQALCEYEDGIKADLENHCPRGSIVGRARAVSPLLKRPLQGNVYFVKNIRRDPRTGNVIRTLPMVIAALRGEVAINLRGESAVDRRNRLVSTFNTVPDAPVTRFNMNIAGGSNGIIAVTRTRQALINLCARPRGHVARADMDGQNGKRFDRNVRMATPCTRAQIRRARQAARKRAARTAAARKAARKQAARRAARRS